MAEDIGVALLDKTAAVDLISECLTHSSAALDALTRIRAYPVGLGSDKVISAVEETKSLLSHQLELLQLHHAELPEFVSLDFRRTIQKVNELLELIPKMVDRHHQGIFARPTILTLPKVIDDLEDNNRALGAVSRMLQFKINWKLNSDIQQLLSSTLRTEYVQSGQSPRVPTESYSGTPATSRKQNFMLPSSLKYNDTRNFTCRFMVNQSDLVCSEELFTEMADHQMLQEWLTPLCQTDHVTEKPSFNLIICGHTSQPGNVTFKDKGALLEVLEAMKVSHDIMYRLLEGVPMLLKHENKNRPSCTQFLFGLPRSQNEDWTMAIFFDFQQRHLNVFIHGMHDEEREAFAHKMRLSIHEIGHPMLLPVIMCEMLAVGDMFAIRTTANVLQNVEARTSVSGVFDATKDARKANKDDQTSFEKMTQTLNRAISSLPTHEARIEVNVLLSERISEILAAMEESHVVDERGKSTDSMQDEWSKKMQVSTDRLKSRLQILQATHKGLLLEIQRESKIASSQMQIVYNLVAQRDNKSNYNMAELSLQIARTAKEDSFAMFTLATMSIIFLPGASIATLFSVDLFNWSPENGESIVNPRFWIFWAVTGPLTAVVLTVWLIWLKVHRRKEDQKSKGITSDGPNHHQIRAWNLRNLWNLRKLDTETQEVLPGPRSRDSFDSGLELGREMPEHREDDGRIERTVTEGPRVPKEAASSPWEKSVLRSYTSAPEGPRRY